MNIQQAIAELIERRDLDLQAMTGVMRQIMTGQATEAQIGGFLVGLRMKGETIDEITAAARVMRELSNAVALHGENLVDIVGTGGDSAGLFNVSTAASFVAAAAGARVAKHGNRSVTSSSGSTDLLEAAGVYLDLSPEQIVRCIDELGIGYMFAVNHHSAMKHAIGPRKQLMVRTIFNILGPLTNPAAVPNMLLGVFSPQWQLPFAQVLDRLGANHVLVVHSADGLDEISIAGPTRVVELNHGKITQYTIRPEDFGLTSAPLESLVVANAADSLALIEQAYTGEAGVARDMLALNAGAALYAAGVSSSIAEGVVLADDVMSSGQAWEKLKQFAEFTTLLGSSESASL
jgi:anthranilate phosphoribosyltransferase